MRNCSKKYSNEWTWLQHRYECNFDRLGFELSACQFFGGFWRKLEELIAAERAFVTEEVIHELSKKDDEACEWAKRQVGFSVPLETEQIAIVKELAKTYPVLAKERLGRMRADGFVIGLAKWKNLTVVTAENHRGPEKYPTCVMAWALPVLRWLT